MNITGVSWSLPDVEESHEINVLAVKVSEDLDWRSDLLDDDGLSCKNLTAFVGKLNDVLFFAWELSVGFDILTLLWLHKRLEEHLA